MIKIGDIVVPRGCSSEYQAANKTVVRHLKNERIETICDGEKVFIEWQSASENGWSWFPLSTLELVEVKYDLP